MAPPEVAEAIDAGDGRNCVAKEDYVCGFLRGLPGIEAQQAARDRTTGVKDSFIRVRTTPHRWSPPPAHPTFHPKGIDPSETKKQQ
jgi:hypothetical protein